MCVCVCVCGVGGSERSKEGSSGSGADLGVLAVEELPEFRQRPVHHLCSPALSTPADTKQLGWRVEFESEVTHRPAARQPEQSGPANHLAHRARTITSLMRWPGDWAPLLLFLFLSSASCMCALQLSSALPGTAAHNGPAGQASDQGQCLRTDARLSLLAGLREHVSNPHYALSSPVLLLMPLHPSHAAAQQYLITRPHTPATLSRPARTAACHRRRRRWVGGVHTTSRCTPAAAVDSITVAIISVCCDPHSHHQYAPRNSKSGHQLIQNNYGGILSLSLG